MDEPIAENKGGFFSKCFGFC